MDKQPKTVRFNRQTHEVRAERRIRSELYLVVGKYGSGRRPREKVLHVLGRNQYQEKVIHVVSDSADNWKRIQNLNRAQGSNLPFARISSVARERDSILVVQEHVPGKSLLWHLSGNNTISPFQAIRLYSQLVNQLCNLARKSGIIHADISPANLIVSTKGTRLVLIDFGSSFRFTETNSKDSGDGFNSKYQSPEILRGDPADRLSEQFGAATVFYEMLTKRLPFSDAEKLDPAMLKVGMPLASERKSESNPELPAVIWRAVDEHLKIALSLQRNNRFATIQQWQDSAFQLKKFAESSSDVIPARKKGPGLFQKWFG